MIVGICRKCAGVVGVSMEDLQTGEYLCECGENPKRRRKKKSKHWKNGRELHNSPDIE